MIAVIEHIEKHSEVYEINETNQTVYFCPELELNETTLPLFYYLCNQHAVLFFSEEDLHVYFNAIKYLNELDKFLSCLNLYEHAYRTSQVVYAILDSLGYDTSITQFTAHAALYHDAGKLCISQTLLQSKKRFNEVEKQYIQLHVRYGKQVVKKLDLPQYIKELSIRLAYVHHERLDGSGYPVGKMEYELSTIDRIIAIADVYSAITENRSYRTACDDELALSLLRNANKFDQRIVSELEKILAYRKF